MGSRLTRREALGGAAAALALASCGGGEPPPASGARPGSGAALLSSLAALELAAAAAYDSARPLLDGEARELAAEIAAREREHAERLGRIIAELGGEPPEGKTRAEYERTFPKLETADDALRFLDHLEQRQLRDHLDALGDLPDLAHRGSVAEIAADQASHLAAVRVLQGLPAADGPFVTGAL